ncbi:MAG: ABC transporter ATP-binding protein [Methanomicrobiales archaeon]|nr:ABC transporter ATP-binding protein [Methanomicrobiales archaeon]
MIRASCISKTYRGRTVLDGVDLSIERGEIFCIVGPNGAGKTTLLRILDLLDRPSYGLLQILGEDATGSESVRFRIRRRMSMLFQRPVIFDTSVFDNVACGLKFRKMGEDEVRGRVKSALREVGLPGLERRRAKELSGGEMQRLALARALVIEPEILFLDEPTTFLDPESANIVNDTMVRLSRDRGTTILFTTHDLYEGERIADRIGVLMDGRFSQISEALEILHHPADLRVAKFVGFENILRARCLSWEAGEALLDLEGQKIYAISGGRCDGDVFVCFRAESVSVGVGEEPIASPRNKFRGTVTRISAFGPFVYITIHCGFDIVAMLTRRAMDELMLDLGSEVWASVKATSMRVFAGAGDAAKKTGTEKH